MKIKPGKINGARGIRTPDPYVANVVLSQLSYCPMKIIKGIKNVG